MNMYFVEESNKLVRISYNKAIMPKYSPYPLRARSFLSEHFQLCMIEAYIQEGWNVDMSDAVKAFWSSRPASFDTRHDND
jgi:hypothetical protein